MRRFFLPAGLDAGTSIRIAGNDANHIKNVLRLVPGDMIEVAGTDGLIGIARLGRVEPEQTIAFVESVKTGGAEPPVSIILAQGLPKADKMDFIVQKAVELGVTVIQPMLCERSIVKYDSKKAQVRVERWQAIAYEAAKQAKRDVVPIVRPVLEFGDVVKNLSDNIVTLMLYEGESENSLRDILKQRQSNCYMLLIGPEGGFSLGETSLCKTAGVHRVTLGPRILRTETASLAAVSIIQYECGDLGGIQCRE